MDAKNLLLKTGLFAKLSEAELDQLIASTKEIALTPNEIFIKKGDRSDVLYVIVSGVCQVFTQDKEGEDIILARLESGDYLGEQALLTEVPGRRNASVRSISEMKLLKITHESFQTILKRDEALKKTLQQLGDQQSQANLVMEELHQVYLSQKRGEIKQYNGKFLDKPAMISNFQLSDGREISIARVLNENIRTVRNTQLTSPEETIFSRENIRRELLIENNVLVGATSYGEWDALPKVINMVFNQTPIDAEQRENFTATGELTVVLPKTGEEPKERRKIVCNCAYVYRRDIVKHIEKGITTLEAISHLTGAGTICGNCRVSIQDILGHAAWQVVRLKKIISLTPEIHAYQLIPALGEKIPPYKAGQYVLLQCFIDLNWMERAYTLTSASTNKEYYEIAIQGEKNGKFSNWFFEHENEMPVLRVSVPSGNFILNFESPTPAICLMAGIGITPGVAFARTAFETKSQRPIYLYFSAHTEEDFAYLNELKKLAEQHPFLKIITRSTKKEGRLEQNDLDELNKKFPDAEYFICGPRNFEMSIQGYLKNIGVSRDKIFVEKFTHSYDLI